MYPPFLSLPFSAGRMGGGGRGEGLNLLPNFQKTEGVGRISVFRGDCLERGGSLFEGGGGVCSFYIKNKLKSEIFKDKKGI